MISPADIERIAHLLAGDAPGWQTRFGTMTGLSRSHVSNLLSGARPITQVVAVKIIDAAQREATALRERAAELDQVLGMLMPKPGEPLPPMTDEPHFRRDEMKKTQTIAQLIVNRAREITSEWSTPAPWIGAEWTGTVSSTKLDPQRHVCISAAAAPHMLIAPVGPVGDRDSVQIRGVLRAAPEYLAALQIIAQTGDERSREIAKTAIDLTGTDRHARIKAAE